MNCFPFRWMVQSSIALMRNLRSTGFGFEVPKRWGAFRVGRKPFIDEALKKR